MWIDTHAHLNMSAFNDDLPEVIENALAKQITQILSVGIDVESSRKAAELSEQFSSVYSSAGIHPHEAKTAGNSEFDKIRDLLSLQKTLAVGETGLDYHYDYSPRAVQKTVFERQLFLARELKKPVIIHVRNAMKDALEIIDSVSTDHWTGVFHCFGGNAEDVKDVLKRGFYISFTGMVTFKNFKNHDVLKAVPLEKLMLETDCPFMSPVPFRGKRNEPALLPNIGNVVAGIFNVSIEELAARTTENAKKCLGFH